MGYDPDGTWDWGKFWRTFGVVVAAVVVVAAITAITVVTGGAAAPVLVGAGLGALTSGAMSAVTQVLSTGRLDFSQLMVDMAVGGVLGAFGGSALGIVGMTVAGAATGFAGSAANDFVAGNSIDWGNAIASAAIGAIFGLLTGGGAQHGRNQTLVHKLAERKVKIANGKPINSINAQIINERILLSKAAIRTLMPNSLWSYTLILQYVAYGTLSAYQHGIK